MPQRFPRETEGTVKIISNIASLRAQIWKRDIRNTERSANHSTAMSGDINRSSEEMQRVTKMQVHHLIGKVNI
jgi:hypothetical protein